KAMLSMSEELKNIVGQISETTADLNVAAGNVGNISKTSYDNIQQQQDETHQIENAMEEMSASVEEVVQNVSNADVAAHLAHEQTEEGSLVVQDTVQGIKQLAKQIEDAAVVIAKVEKDSENINTVLDVIKGIAEQTNLLALNAAIEAARAGEQGRGFAVVADEVRTLAGRTQESTAEINEIIEKLQTGSRSSVKVMSQSCDQAQSVVELASKAGTSLITISESVAKINEMTTQIATTAQKQASVSQDMNKKITDISNLAKENANSSQGMAVSGEEVQLISVKLQSIVQRFKV
ncbi:MAG: methyl-accepting chemotaxis protein, partial [Saccharospirillaceae bacterium]|nr:methyl-accepting chemotaxis protein [Pseudomonadales bacterium]NRB78846.1 methyl-accepting chemotaxis protein [Saccharospirillaceae bacterium]